MPAASSRSSLRSAGLPALVVLAAIALVSVNLRPGATSVGPVLAELRDGLGMDATTAGVVLGLPGLCFAVAGAFAVRLGRRVGVTAGLALGLVAVAAGLLLRVTTDSVAVFVVLTMVALSGMAIGNVLVPAWIKVHDHQVLLMTVYATVLIIGGTVGALFAAPLVDGLGGWRPGLGAWGVLTLLAVPLWVWLAHRERRSPLEHRVSSAPRDGRLLHSGTAVALTVMFGIQSMHAYVQFGWLPQIYRDAGLGASYAGVLTGLVNAVGILGALVMPTVIARGRRLPVWMTAFGILLVLGYLGLLLAPATVPWLWALLLGGAGMAFPMSIALLTARTRTSEVTGRLSGFVQPIGYLLAALGPFLVGVLYESTGEWDLVLWLLVATAVPFTVAGLRAVRHTYVDDELERVSG